MYYIPHSIRHFAFWGAALAVVFCFGQCALESNKEAAEAIPLELVELADDNGFTESFTRLPDSFAKQGEYRRADPQGRLLELAHYERDTLQGVRILFRESGDTLQVENYRMGSFDGPYRQYYPGNRLMQVGRYEANAMEGVWVRYYDTGELMEEVTFEGNEENGPFKEYYRNGQLKAEGEYLEGDFEHGLLRLYDEAGKLTKTMQCNRGVCKTVRPPIGE